MGCAAEASDELMGQVRPESFFLSEWRARRPGESRSLRRARDLAEVLGLDNQIPPVVSVVGSKGKGTAATYASAFLAAAGNRVVTVTSPGYRGAAERIRMNGRAVSAAELLALAARLQEAVQALPGRADYGGYLAPTGLFTLAGVLHAEAVGAGIIVLEAGMGGRSDEISLFPATAVAITPVFAEHLGKLGDTPAEIAREKAAIVASRTRAVVTVPQPAEVWWAIEDTVAQRLGTRTPVEVVDAGSTALPKELQPAGLNAANATLGCAAGRRLLDAIGQNQPSTATLAAVLNSVRLPGRLSRHRIPGLDTELLVDSAINQAGIAAALAVAGRWWSGIDHVLVCLPDHKDVAGAIIELAGLPVTFVRLPAEHLRFTHPLPAHWSVMDAADLTRELVSSLGRRILTLGTVYFAGHMLDLAEADTERLFVAHPEALRARSHSNYTV